MNTLSYVLYFSDVIPSIAGFIRFIGVSLIGIWIILGLVSKPSDRSAEFPFHGWAVDGVRQIKLVVLGVIIIIVSLTIPSKETFYMIAASELGETVVTSPEAKEIMSDIQEVIKGKLNQMKSQ